MLASITSAQFTAWMSFYSAEMQIRKEAADTAMLEREALQGAEEMRGKLRGNT